MFTLLEKVGEHLHVEKNSGLVLIDDYSESRVTTMGHIVEVMTMKKSTSGSPCRKIDKDHYFDIRTGDVFEYQHTENRSGSYDSIRRTLANIRSLINTNIVNADNCRWVTLTYAENITDRFRLMVDYEKFWKRFCYWCAKNGHGKPEYISVIEPQARGAWHVHAFFIWSSKAPYVSNDKVLKALWGHGWTKVKAVTDCDNIGAYFSAYLGDVPEDEISKLSLKDQIQARSATGTVQSKEFIDDDGTTKTKKFIKGGRLFMYPAGMNILRYSKGIQQPLMEKMDYLQAQKKVSAATETFSCTYDIVGEDGEPINSICKQYYNFKRSKGQ